MSSTTYKKTELIPMTKLKKLNYLVRRSVQLCLNKRLLRWSRTNRGDHIATLKLQTSANVT